jgi:hypothetical protein
VRVRRRLAIVAAALLLSLVACEAAVRVLVRTDDTGQRWLGDLRLLPYRLPQAQIAATLARLERGDTFLAYDPDLGWAPRPHARSTSGPFRVNGAGIRADDESAAAPRPGVLRIALFGDSFTFGDEVPLEDTWGAALERGLAARGVAAEVLNFGVNAYGMDQAYLRWKRDGRRFHPDVVIYGFQPENVLRDLNVFRPLYFAGTEVPLSKPRLVIDGDELVTLNVPTIPPAEMPQVLATLPEQPLLAHERFYDPWYAPHWWEHSALAAALATVAATREDALFRLDDEGHALAGRIAGAFAHDVAASGAAFLVVHLPRKQDLLAKRSGRDLWYAPLLRDLDARFTVLSPTDGLGEVGDALFARRGHYARPLNEIVGRALVEPVLAAAHERTGAPRLLH